MPNTNFEPEPGSREGGRLPLLEPAALNREQRDVYDRIAETMVPWAEGSGFAAATGQGRLLGPFNAMLYNTELGQAQLDLLEAERASTCLDASVREVVILTVGAHTRAAYELYAHRAVAAKAGLQPADIEALATGAEPPSLSPDGLLAHRFTRAFVEDHRVPEPLFREAEAAFGHRGLVDMVHLAGIYLLVSGLLNAFDVPVPPDAAPAA